MAELSVRDLWEACGGAGELRLLIEHPSQSPRGVVVETPFVLLGSSESAGVYLPDDDVSRKHACIQSIGGQLWCFDLISRTGTYWGPRRRHAGWFDASEVLRLGPYKVRLFPDRRAVEGHAASPFRPIPLEQDSFPTATLEFLNAHRPGSVHIPSFQLDRPLTLVGQSPRCKIRFSCPTVSTCHCSLLRTPHGIWVIDLQSREGISINGTKVRWARLRDGDCLGIGRFEVLVRVLSRRVPPAPCMPPIAEPARASLELNAELSAPAISQAVPAISTREISASPLSSALTKSASSSALATLCAESSALSMANVSAISPPATTGGDATQTLLLTFVNQFSMMQQQMFDQFQQTTMMMMQMFGTLQRDQLQLVRQELDSLRELNREIVSLQAEMAKHQAESRAGRRPPAAATESKAAAPRPSLVGSSPANGGAPKSPSHAEMKAAVAAPTNSPVPPDDDVHAWLSQRFLDLQQESKSRWQKLLATVVGH